MNTLSVNRPAGIAVPMDPGWDDQMIYAVGIAYAVTDRLNLRAGFNYGESPIDENTAASNNTISRSEIFGCDMNFRL